MTSREFLPYVQEDDRVLLLFIPAPDLLLDLSCRLTRGTAVLLSTDVDAVYDGRRVCRDVENMMFVPWDGKEIPWQDGLFTLAAGEGEPAEVARVLRDGGRWVTELAQVPAEFERDGDVWHRVPRPPRPEVFFPVLR